MLVATKLGKVGIYNEELPFITSRSFAHVVLQCHRKY